jgi:hypothetical protein
VARVRKSDRHRHDSSRSKFEWFRGSADPAGSSSGEVWWEHAGDKLPDIPASLSLEQQQRLDLGKLVASRERQEEQGGKDDWKVRRTPSAGPRNFA